MIIVMLLNYTNLLVTLEIFGYFFNNGSCAMRYGPGMGGSVEPPECIWDLLLLEQLALT
jgi:hypothetical protein